LLGFADLLTDLTALMRKFIIHKDWIWRERLGPVVAR